MFKSPKLTLKELARLDKCDAHFKFRDMFKEQMSLIEKRREAQDERMSDESAG